jgi:hypothetical protein
LKRGVARFVRAEGISVAGAIARPGQGKCGGWRTLIAYRQGQRSVFLLDFEKNDLDGIGPDQLASLKTPPLVY